MKRMQLVTVLALVAVGVSGCRWGLFGPHRELSIHGHWVNAEEPPTPLDGCVLHFATSQVGEASHLGAFTGVGETCIPTPPEQTDDPPHFFYDPAPPYFVASFVNEMVWTTSTGDLWLEPNPGVFVQSLATSQVSVKGTLQVAGGTGRWSGATGELVVRNTTEDGFELEFEGSIRLDR